MKLTDQDLQVLEELLAKAKEEPILFPGDQSRSYESVLAKNVDRMQLLHALRSLAPQLIAAAKVGLEKETGADVEIEKGTGAENCAWLHFTGCGELDDGCHKHLVTCDSASPGAFKVYRHPPAASVPTKGE